MDPQTTSISDFCPFLTPDVREALEFETEAYNIWKLAMHRNRKEYIEDRIYKQGGTIARASREWRTGFTKAVKQHNEKYSPQAQNLFVKTMESIMDTYSGSITVAKNFQTYRLALDDRKDLVDANGFKKEVETVDAETQTVDADFVVEDEPYIDVESLSDSENEVSEQPTTSSAFLPFQTNDFLSIQRTQESAHQQTNLFDQLNDGTTIAYEFTKNALNSRETFMQTVHNTAEQLGIAQRLNYLPPPPLPLVCTPDTSFLNTLAQQPAAPVTIPQLHQPIPTPMLQNYPPLNMMPNNGSVLPNFDLAQLMMQNCAPGFYVHPNSPQFQ